MRTTPFTFPPHQAVVVYHPDLTEGCGLMAIVAPTFTPCVHHVGIAEVNGQNWKFINGPTRVNTSRAWQKLFKIHEDWESSTSVFLDPTHDWSIPAYSPDHLIDLITGRDDG